MPWIALWIQCESRSMAPYNVTERRIAAEKLLQCDVIRLSDR